MTRAFSSMARKIPTVLAISSGGGHWVQLLRVRPAFADCNVIYATVSDEYRVDLEPGAILCVVPDSNLWNKLNLVRSAVAILLLLLRIRPDVVVTTGAAPGYFAARIGKMVGARVVWIDSIANAEELSLSGKMAGRFADLWLTQWSHLARDQGPVCFGNVL